MIKTKFGLKKFFATKNLVCGQRKHFWSLSNYLTIKYMLLLTFDNVVGTMRVHVALLSANSITFNEPIVNF